MSKILFYILKIILFLILIGAVMSFDFDNSSLEEREVLNLVITVNGILIAVITTFLYSKILLERSERIQIKGDIDFISIKLTSLRRVAIILSRATTFWITPSNTVYANFPGISIFGLRQFSYDQFTDFLKKTGMSELSSQAFLSLKYIEGEDSRELALNQNYRKNYNLELISEYHECCSFVYSYCEEYHARISLVQWDEDRIRDEIDKIDPSLREITPQSLGILFNDFSTRNLENLFKLTAENKKGIGALYNWIYFDMFTSFLVLLLSIIGFVYFDLIGIIKNFLVLGTLWIVADLLLNTYYSLKNEIIIKQFFK